MKSLIIGLIGLTFFQACKPPVAETQFNPLVQPPEGTEARFSTDEDTPVQVRYEVESLEDSIDLWVKLKSGPKHGSISNCDTSVKNAITCLYTPNADFDGTDEIILSQGDGGLEATMLGKVLIEINPIADAPQAKNASFGFNSGAETLHTFMVPLAYDPDSAAFDLQYSLIDSDGAQLGSCFENKGERSCSVSVAANFQGKYTMTYKVTDQDNLNSNIANITVDFSKDTYTADVTFKQEEGEKPVNGADIVWVVDNSGSMGNDQANLKNNFQSFINNFLVDGKARFNFNMGITTTDAYAKAQGTKLFETDAAGNIYNLSSARAESDFAGFKTDFEEAVLVGTSGSGSEKALPSLDACYKEHVSWFGGNDRLLVAIIVTDEREQSDKSIAEWTSQFKALKDDPNKVKIFPIVNIAGDNGDRFKTLAEGFGVTRSDIDQPFDGVLNSISSTIANELLSRFPLDPNHDVIVNTLQVTVNNAPVTLGADYDFQSGAIVFNNPPAAESVIRVRYSYQWK